MTKPLDAEPGDVVTAIFSVRNASDEARTYRALVELPNGWRLVSALAPFSVAPGQTVRRLISFRVSAKAAVGSFAVGYRVTDVSESDVYDTGLVTVAVGENQKFDVEVLDAPSWVMSEADFEVSLMLANVGNARRVVTLVPTSVPEVDVELSLASELSFEPGERRTLVVRMKAVRAIQRRQRQWLRVAVRSDEAVVGEIAVPVDVLPVGREYSRSGRFPVVLKLHGFSSYRGRGGQVEIEGRGAVREGDNAIIDIGIRTPDLSSSSLFARRDEYRFAYIEESWALLVGDQPFSLSPLTEYGRRGRGIGAVGKTGPLTATAFFSRSRYALPREDIVGLNLTYSLTDALRFGANFVDKTGHIPGESITLRSEYEPIKDVHLDLEVGDGGDFGVRSGAVAAGIRGIRSYGSVDARFMRLGPSFPGLYQDRALSSLNVGVTPIADLRFDGSYSQDNRRLQFGSAAGSTIETRFVRIGSTYGHDLPIGVLRVSAAYKYQAQNATFDSAHENRNSLSTEVKVGYEVGRFDFGASAELGSAFANFVEHRMGASKYELTTHADLGPISYTMAAQFERGASMYRLGGQRSTLLSVGLEGHVRDRFRWGVDALVMSNRTFISRRYQSIASRVEYRLPVGHTVAVRANVSGFGLGLAEFGHDVSVTYEVPLGVPTLRKAGPWVRGRVVDALTGAGVGGVLVRVGKRTARTGRDGAFAIYASPAESEFLFVDAATIGLDRVTLIETPLEVTRDLLDSGVEIPVAPASSIRGIVNRFVFSSGSRQTGSLTASESEPGVVVEFNDGVGRYRVSSGSDGRFALTHLRPGTWTVRIVYANLPETHAIGEPVTVHVRPGERIDVELKTIPRRRQIRFVARGKLGQIADPDSSAATPSRVDSSGTDLDDTALDDTALDDTAVGGQQPARQTEGRVRPDPTSTRTRVCNASMQLPASHDVRPGETLTQLARQYYCDGTGWPLIWFGNADVIDNPHLIVPGDVVRIPPVGGNRGFDPSPTMGSDRQHTVDVGDSLESIAIQYYGDAAFWPRIWMANPLAFERVTDVVVGSTLTIPGGSLHRFERRYLLK